MWWPVNSGKCRCHGRENGAVPKSGAAHSKRDKQREGATSLLMENKEKKKKRRRSSKTKATTTFTRQHFRRVSSEPDIFLAFDRLLFSLSLSP